MGDADVFVKQIHEHGFAAADAAINIEPEGRILAAPGKAEAFLPAGGARRRRIAGQRPVQALQLFRQQLLRRIGFQRPIGDALAVIE